MTCLAAGDFHAESMPEALFCIIFMFLNVGITAYIIVRCLSCPRKRAVTCTAALVCVKTGENSHVPHLELNIL